MSSREMSVSLWLASMFEINLSIKSVLIEKCERINDFVSHTQMDKFDSDAYACCVVILWQSNMRYYIP